MLWYVRFHKLCQNRNFFVTFSCFFKDFIGFWKKLGYSYNPTYRLAAGSRPGLQRIELIYLSIYLYLCLQAETTLAEALRGGPGTPNSALSPVAENQAQHHNHSSRAQPLRSREHGNPNLALPHGGNRRPQMPQAGLKLSALWTTAPELALKYAVVSSPDWLMLIKVQGLPICATTRDSPARPKSTLVGLGSNSPA